MSQMPNPYDKETAMTTLWARLLAICTAALACTLSHAGGIVGNTLPAGFPSIETPRCTSR